MKEEYDHIEDEQLARWLSGEMEEKERLAFEKTDAYHTYQLIAQYSGNLTVPTYDADNEFQKVQSQLTQKPTAKIIGLHKRQWFSIAAAITLLIGIGGFWMSRTAEELVAVTTASQSTKLITLPNKSKVQLNVASTIEYDKASWEDERAITLSGEAFFQVTKGRKFSVQTTSGTIEVLGTSFNIRERGDVLEVICYSGKVKVSDNHQNAKTLTKGDAVKLHRGQFDEEWDPAVGDSEPNWKNGESWFDDAPFTNALTELEHQYGVKIQNASRLSERSYSGVFPHDDLKQAAWNVFTPMGVEYEIVGDSVIVIE